jgi:broad specificity phosphatase PhoE
MAVELIYETHSVTTDNEAGIATGWLPGELSPTGRQLARQLGRRHRGADIAAVFVSDLTRAVQTAQIAFGDRGIPIHTDLRLRECNYGTHNGMPVAQLAAERSRHIDHPSRAARATGRSSPAFGSSSATWLAPGTGAQLW